MIEILSDLYKSFDWGHQTGSSRLSPSLGVSERKGVQQPALAPALKHWQKSLWERSSVSQPEFSDILCTRYPTTSVASRARDTSAPRGAITRVMSPTAPGGVATRASCLPYLEEWPFESLLCLLLEEHQCNHIHQLFQLKEEGPPKAQAPNILIGGKDE